MRRGILIGVAMNDPQQHFTSHPYYRMAVAAERHRILAELQAYMGSLVSPSYSINITTLIELIQDDKK
jgi:hypothetical protein